MYVIRSKEARKEQPARFFQLQSYRLHCLFNANVGLIPLKKPLVSVWKLYSFFLIPEIQKPI